MKIRRSFPLLLLLAALLLPPLSSGAETPSRRYLIGRSDPVDWGVPSPFTFYQRGPGYVQMMMIFDSLVWKDDKRILPWLAESWTYQPVSRTYTFKLRKGVTWADGRPFTAFDVVFTYQYYKKNPHPWFPLRSVKGVKAPDPLRVEIQLAEPYAPFLDTIAGCVPILPRHIWEEVQDPYKFTEPGSLVGTGPYTLKTYAGDRGYYEFKANPKFWGPAPFITSLAWQKVGDPQFAALKGEVDHVEIKPEAASLMPEKKIKVFRLPHVWNAKLMINHKKPPMDRKEFRQALACALDLGEIVRLGLRGYGKPASAGLIPPASPWYNPATPKYGHDLSRVKELMTALGYKVEGGFWSKEGKPLKLTVLVWKQFERVAQIADQQLRRANFNVEFQSLAMPTLDAKVMAWEFDLAFSGHGGIGGDPVLFDAAVKADALNSARFRHPELDRLIDEQIREMDPDKRKETVNRLQLLYADLLPALSLYYPTHVFADSGKVPLFYTLGGIGRGVPNFQNKISFITGVMP